MGLGLLIILLVCSLIWSGCLIWVDNSLALIPDSDPRTQVNIEQLYGLDDGHSDHHLYDANQPHDQTGGQLFVRGNGGRDDNRPRSIEFKKLTAAVLIPPCLEAVSNFNERRTVAAYTDYGHLKVPADSDSTSIFMYIFRATRITGSPFLWPPANNPVHEPGP